jgi:hypothetical protein
MEILRQIILPHKILFYSSLFNAVDLGTLHCQVIYSDELEYEIS